MTSFKFQISRRSSRRPVSVLQKEHVKRATAYVASVATLLAAFMAVGNSPSAAFDFPGGGGAGSTYYWTNSSGDGKWSTLENWSTDASWHQNGGEYAQPMGVPGDGTQQNATVDISTYGFDGEPIEIVNDMPNGVRLGEGDLFFHGDVALTGGELYVDGVVINDHAPELNSTEPNRIRFESALFFGSDRELYPAPELYGQGTNTELSLGGAAISSDTNVRVSGMFTTLEVSAGCPWVTDEIVDDSGMVTYTSNAESTQGATVAVSSSIEVQDFECSDGGDGGDGGEEENPGGPSGPATPTGPGTPTNPVVGKATAISGSIGATSIDLGWKAPAAAPHDGSELKGYFVSRFTGLTDQGVPDPETGGHLATIGVDGRVTAASGKLITPAPAEQPTTYSMRDSAQIVMRRNGVVVAFDPREDYYYVVQAFTTTGLGEVSAPLNLDVPVNESMSLKVTPRTTPRPGLTTPIDVRLANGRSTSYDGVNFTMTLPMTAFQALRVNQALLPKAGKGDRGWTCRTSLLPNHMSLASCSNPAPLRAGRPYPALALNIDIPANAALMTFLLDYSASTKTLGPGQRSIALSSNVPFRLPVAAAERAHLSTKLSGPITLPPYSESGEVGWEKVVARVENEGKAETTGPVTLRFPLPFPTTESGSPKPGAVIWDDQADEDLPTPGWECTESTAQETRTVLCVSAEAIPAGGAAPDLGLPLAAMSVSVGTAPTRISAMSTSTDAFGEITNSAQMSVKLPALVTPAVTASSRSYDPQNWTTTGEIKPLSTSTGVVLPDNGMTATVKESAILGLRATNAGQTRLRTKLSFVETVPMSSVVRYVGGTGWDCSRDQTTVSCLNNSVDIDAGQTLSGPTLVVSPVTTAPILSASAFQGSLYVVSHDQNGNPIHSAPVTTDLGTPAGTVAPAVSTMATVAAAPLTPGFSTKATFSLLGHPSAGESSPRVLVFLAPSQVALEGGAIEKELTGYPQSTDSPECVRKTGSIPGGYSAAVLCYSEAVVKAQSKLDATVGFTVGQNVVGGLAFPTGALNPGAGTPSSVLDQAWATVRSLGTAALHASSSLNVESVVIRADAGPDQQVDASTAVEDESGSLKPKPTRVILDASATTSIGRPLGFVWKQVAGPAVTWEPNGDGTDPGAGERPSFDVPSVDVPTTLTFAVTATDSGGPASGRATTTVTVDPVAPMAPAVLSVRAFGADGTTELETGTTPPEGSAVFLNVSYRDLDSGSVSVTPTISAPTELSTLPFQLLSNTRDGDDGVARFKMTWPVNAWRLAIGFRLADGSMGPSGALTSTRGAIAIGPDSPTLGITIATPEETVAPGSTVRLETDITNGTHNGSATAVTWSQPSGRAGILTGSGTGANFTVPASARAGDVFTFQALARRGAGSGAATATASVVLTAGGLSPLTVDEVSMIPSGGEGDLVAGGDAQLSTQVSGGVAPYTARWLAIVGNDSFDAVRRPEGEPASSFHAEVSNLSAGAGSVMVTITDAAGQVSSQTLAYEVGEPVAPTPSESACAVNGPLGIVREAAYNFTQTGLSKPTEHIVISYGDAVVDFGPAGTLFAALPEGVACGAGWEAPIAGASMTYRGIGITEAVGTLTPSGLELESGAVTLPSSWQLDDVSVEDVVIGFTDDLAITGTLSATDIPLLGTQGLALTNFSSTMTLGEDLLSLTATASQSTGPGTVSMSGAFCWSASEDCADVAVFDEVAASELAVRVEADGLRAFGATFGGSGVLRTDGDEVDGEVKFGLTSGTVTMPASTLVVNTAELTWTPETLAFDLGATVSDKVSIDLSGTYTDENNWSAVATGGVVSAWNVAPGLTLPAYDAGNKTGTAVVGTVSSSTAAPASASKPATTIALRLVTKELVWDVGPMTVHRIAITLGHGGTAPAACGLSGSQLSGAYLSVGGSALIQTGSSPVTVDTDFCVVPGVSWKAVTKATSPSFTPVRGLNLTGVSLAAQHKKSPESTSIALAAQGTVLGKFSGAAVVSLDSKKRGTDFAASLTVGLNDAGLGLSGTGRVIYTSEPIANLAQSGINTGLASVGKAARNCSDSSAVAGMDGISVRAGFTAIAQFQMGSSNCEFLTSKLGFPAATSVVASVNVGATTPSVSLAVSAGEDGVQIFRKSDGTELRLNSAEVTIDSAGGLGLVGASSLYLPRPDIANATQLARLDASASINITVTGVPSMTVGLTVDSDNWTDALGITGLTLSQAAFSIGVSFAAIPVPSIGITATASDVPKSWKDALGIVRAERMGFALNVSASAPIVAITLGEHDGQTFIQPVQSMPEVLEIDFAKLVLAPFGGRIGTVEFPAGMSLSFGAQVVGVSVHFDATLDIAASSLRAEASVGAFTVGPVSLDRTEVRLAIDPGSLEFKFTGGFTLNANPLSTASAGATRVEATVDVKANSGGSFDLAFAAEARNVSLGGVATINNLALSASVSLSSGTRAVDNAFALAGLGDVTVLGRKFVLGGAIVYSNGALQSFDAIAASDAFSIGPVSLGGRGCAAGAVDRLPEVLKIGAKRLVLPTSGPCLQVGVRPGTSTPFTLSISASMAVAGLSVELDGGIDRTGIEIKSASVQLTDAVTAKIYNSRFYYSAANDLGGARIVHPVTQASHVASNGDFRLQGTVAAKLAGFVEGDLKVDLGRIGAADAIWARGSLTVGLLQNANSPIHADVALIGDFSKSGGSYVWSLAGNADLLLGGTKSGSGWVDAYRIAGASFTLNNSGLRANGQLQAGPVSANVQADIGWADGVTFTVSGTGQIALLGTQAAASLEVTNKNPLSPGTIIATAKLNANIGEILVLNGSGTFTSGGAMCLGGTGRINLPAVGGAPDLGSLAATLCTPQVPGRAAGFSAQAQVMDGRINLGISITDAGRFLAYGTAGFNARAGEVKCTDWGWLGEACGGAEASAWATVMVAVSSHNTTFFGSGHQWTVGKGISLAGNAGASARICIAACVGGSVRANIQFNPTKFCGGVGGYNVCFQPPSRVTW